MQLRYTASAMLIDTPDTCALRVGWQRLATDELYTLREMIDLCEQSGGSYHDGDEFTALLIAVEDELAARDTAEGPYDSPSLQDAGLYLGSYAS